MSLLDGSTPFSMYITDKQLRILQVSTADRGGGAANVAWELFQACRSRSHKSWLAVGVKRSEDPDVFQVQNERGRNYWAATCDFANQRLQPLVGKVRGVGRVQGLLQKFAEPYHTLEYLQGHEDFGFPGTYGLLDRTPERPTIVHCHNLHGGYFDLRALPWLSGQVPTVLTLHDAWLLSGHCALSLACERWKTGCGSCPDLTLYPSIYRDGTAYNWRRKRGIFARSKLYVATPSRWLMLKVEQSMLAQGVEEARVIPNGVDLSCFHPADRPSVRAVLGIPQSAKMLLFAANGIRKNIWKDYATLRSAVARVDERIDGQGLLFVALGEEAPTEQVGRTEIRFVPYQKDPGEVARYYQATDVYVHAAREDTFPNTVLEALSCGKPVVATAVGGIPEQVEQGETGFLVPPNDAESMSEAIVTLLTDEQLNIYLGRNAARDAKQRFDLKRQVDDYITWYQAISMGS